MIASEIDGSRCLAAPTLSALIICRVRQTAKTWPHRNPLIRIDTSGFHSSEQLKLRKYRHERLSRGPDMAKPLPCPVFLV